jgi:hypothetical protein
MISSNRKGTHMFLSMVNAPYRLSPFRLVRPPWTTWMDPMCSIISATAAETPSEQFWGLESGRCNAWVKRMSRSCSRLTARMAPALENQSKEGVR